MKEYPNYYSITPATVRYDKRLKAYERLLFGEITALSNVKGYCYSTNKYFANLYQVTIPTISKWINHLKELGYLRVEMIKNGKEIKERHLYPIVGPINQKVNTPINRNVKENNTSNNNTTTTNAFTEYQKLVGMLSPTQMTTLSEFIRNLSDEVVKFAINKMFDATTTPNFSYLNHVLMDYETLGITTVEKAKEHEKQRQAVRKSPKRKGKTRTNEPDEEWEGW